MTLYLWLASALWVSPGDEGTPGGPGDAFYFFLVLVPLFLAFVVANAVFLFFILREVRLSKGKLTLTISLVLATLWFATVAFDHKKSFRIVEPQYSVAHRQLNSSHKVVFRAVLHMRAEGAYC